MLMYVNRARDVVVILIYCRWLKESGEMPPTLCQQCTWVYDCYPSVTLLVRGAQRQLRYELIIRFDF